MNDTKEYIEQHQANCNATRNRLKDAGMLGPWMHEKDRIKFKHAGMNCLMIRVPHWFHWCGYVGLKPGHEYYGRNYDDIPVEVHWGLTYASACARYICHIPEPGEPEHLYWLGFDCAHSGDLSPLSELYFRFGKDTYRDEEWVKRETMQLAEQLAGIT